MHWILAADAPPIDVPAWFWEAFIGGVVVLLVLDMAVFHRKPHEVRTREAVGWTIFWVGLALAFNAWSTEVGNTVLGVADPTGSDPEIVRLDDSGRVFGHIPPVWSEGEVVWARLSETDTVEVCRAAIGASADCTDTGRSRILGLSVGSGGVVASLDGGVGAWSVETVAW